LSQRQARQAILGRADSAVIMDAAALLSRFGIVKSIVLVFIRIMLKFLEQILLVSIQAVVRSRNDDVRRITNECRVHIGSRQLFDPMPLLRLQLALEIFIRQSLVGQEATGRDVLVISEVFRPMCVPPEAGREQQKNAGPEKETALPLQAGLAQQMLE